MMDVIKSLPKSLPEITTGIETKTIAGASDFQAIMDAEQPVILTGLFDRWPALAAARDGRILPYLKGFDRGAPVPVMEAPPSSGGRFVYSSDLRDFNFTKRQRPMAEALDAIEANDADDASFVAVQMLPLSSHMPEFVRANPLPLLPPQIMPRLWVGGRVKTQTHNDRDHNIACVVAGRRRFILFPPDQVHNLYVGPLDNPPPLSLADPEAPDFERFPRFREAMAAARVAYLGPGEALFMPKYWWHHVTSLEACNVMVNYWWGDFATGLERANDAFLTALLALKDLPPGERRYWREMFDTYIFGAREGALDHIPDALRGPLGPLTPALRQRLKQELKMAYLKS